MRSDVGPDIDATFADMDVVLRASQGRIIASVHTLRQSMQDRTCDRDTIAASRALLERLRDRYARSRVRMGRA